MNKVLDEIRRRCNTEKSHTTKADIKRIEEAKQSGDWSAVYNSRLYRLHGGEYCELLSVMHIEKIYHIALIRDGKTIDVTEVDAYSNNEAFELAKTVFNESGHVVTLEELVIL